MHYFIFFLIIFLTFIIEIQPLEAALKMFKTWTNSQALIYFNKPLDYPDCFGTFINSYYVLTATSCLFRRDFIQLLLKIDFPLFLSERDVDKYWELPGLRNFMVFKVYVIEK